ncbi:MAG: GAF domain-containing protein [Calditrichaeota bacterium]|nr:GAF domain-containing protein [Calditrichota bacterium]
MAALQPVLNDGLPVLALVKEKPPRLRYRLIQLGITDYLTVPFDRLDVEVRVRNLLRKAPVVQPEPALDEALAEAFQSSDREDVSAFRSEGVERISLPDLHVDGQNGEESNTLYALEIFQELFGQLNAALRNVNEEHFNNAVLDALQRLCQAEMVFKFDVEEHDLLKLRQTRPRKLIEKSWTVAAADIPALFKAMRLGEPTILNMVKEDHPLARFVMTRLGRRIRSFIVFPVVIDNQTRSVLCAFKSGEEKFSEFHFLVVQNLAHVMFQVNFLSNLRKENEGKLDNEIWQFYFEFLDQVINQLSFGIVIIGEDHRIKFLNEHAAELLNITAEEGQYRPLSQFLGKNAVEEIIASVGNSTLPIERPELEVEIQKGHRFLLGYSVKEFSDKVNKEHGYIISLKDITYTKEMQEEMRRVDRLASLGVMASGIAHEIRNPLAGIKAMAQTFEEELEPSDPKNEYVQRIVRLVNRLDDLLRTLFSYAKPSKPDRRYCHIQSTLRDVISLLIQKMREHQIELVENIQKDLPEAFVDPGQIQQVLVNLFLNSIEAISEKGRIGINIRAINSEDAGEMHVPILGNSNSPAFIEIHIGDNGCGISEENLQHIFNPFFTTKTFGTGLGLSIVYQIVKENEGMIHYESEIDRGTDCYLYIPAKRYEAVAAGGGQA